MVKKTASDLIELPTDKKAGIGITLTDHTEIESDTDVRINSGSIGGPSAGLMFTLEIYEQSLVKICDMVSKLPELERSTAKEKSAESEESIKKWQARIKPA